MKLCFWGFFFFSTIPKSLEIILNGIKWHLWPQDTPTNSHLQLYIYIYRPNDTFPFPYNDLKDRPTSVASMASPLRTVHIWTQCCIHSESFQYLDLLTLFGPSVDMPTEILLHSPLWTPWWFHVSILYVHITYMIKYINKHTFILLLHYFHIWTLKTCPHWHLQPSRQATNGLSNYHISIYGSIFPYMNLKTHPHSDLWSSRHAHSKPHTYYHIWTW